MGGAVSTGLDNDDLIDNLMHAHYIKSPEIERVFRSVDRAAYFLPDFQMNAYKDLAWKSGNIHISAPCIYSVVMENLNLSPGLSFLNVGSGTGYLSTMVGLLLGPFGVNHGIEMYPDVIKYANEKLHDFKKKSPALDCFEFCEPIFVRGNGLSLPSNMRQYDRVYCGAACPDNHENYMKNLINVGGVLVMPHNDQLLQITRVSETEWEHKSVLPVSFSTLQLPSVLDVKTSIMLPDTEPASLQAVCRSCIRRTLRRNAEREHPELTKTRRRRPYPRKNRALRNFVIPFLDSSDDETENNLRTSTLVIGGPSSITAFLDIRRQGSNPAERHRRFILRGCTTNPRFAERYPRLPSDLVIPTPSTTNHEVVEPGNENTFEEVPEAPVTSQHPGVVFPVPKREKFDSGIVDDLDNGKDSMSSDDEADTNLNYQMTSDEDTMDMDSDSDFVEPDKSGDEGVEEDFLDAPKAGSKPSSKIENEEPELTYRSAIQEKIQSLPLPPMLKSYLNFYRDF